MSFPSPTPGRLFTWAQLGCDGSVPAAVRRNLMLLCAAVEQAIAEALPQHTLSLEYVLQPPKGTPPDVARAHVEGRAMVFQLLRDGRPVPFGGMDIPGAEVVGGSFLRVLVGEDAAPAVDTRTPQEAFAAGQRAGAAEVHEELRQLEAVHAQEQLEAFSRGQRHVWEMVAGAFGMDDATEASVMGIIADLIAEMTDRAGALQEEVAPPHVEEEPAPTPPSPTAAALSVSPAMRRRRAATGAPT